MNSIKSEMVYVESFHEKSKMFIHQFQRNKKEEEERNSYITLHVGLMYMFIHVHNVFKHENFPEVLSSPELHLSEIFPSTSPYFMIRACFSI